MGPPLQQLSGLLHFSRQSQVAHGRHLKCWRLPEARAEKTQPMRQVLSYSDEVFFVCGSFHPTEYRASSECSAFNFRFHGYLLVCKYFRATGVPRLALSVFVCGVCLSVGVCVCVCVGQCSGDNLDEARSKGKQLK